MGGVLPLVLAISIVIAAITASLIMVAYYYRISNIQYNTSYKLSRSAASGVQYMMANLENIPYNYRSAIDLFGEAEDSVLLFKKRGGVYDAVTSMTYKRNQSFFRNTSKGTISNSENNMEIGVVIFEGKSYFVDENKTVGPFLVINFNKDSIWLRYKGRKLYVRAKGL